VPVFTADISATKKKTFRIGDDAFIAISSEIEILKESDDTDYHREGYRYLRRQ